MQLCWYTPKNCKKFKDKEIHCRKWIIPEDWIFLASSRPLWIKSFILNQFQPSVFDYGTLNIWPIYHRSYINLLLAAWSKSAALALLSHGCDSISIIFLRVNVYVSFLSDVPPPTNPLASCLNCLYCYVLEAAGAVAKCNPPNNAHFVCCTTHPPSPAPLSLMELCSQFLF